MIINMTGGGGGGAALNFKVVGNPQPNNPKENTNWVDTDVKITSWIFSATEPENPVEGMVWITTGISSNARFNALKKNGIQVYPISAKQYVSGAWVDVEAKTYQNGEWVDWLNIIFDNGVFGTEYVASTNNSDFGLAADIVAGTASIEGNELVFGDNITSSGGFACGGFVFYNVNLAGLNTLKITRSKQTVSGSGGGDICWFRVLINGNQVYFDNSKTITSDNIISIDVSAYGENSTIAVSASSGGQPYYTIITHISKIIAE